MTPVPPDEGGTGKLAVRPGAVRVVPSSSRGPSLPTSTARRPRLVIDGRALVDDHFSGIGHYAMSLLQALDELLAEETDVDVRVAVPVRRIGHLRRFGFRRIRPLPIPMPYTLLRRLTEEGRLPRMDLVCGRGTYFFPNYVRWPLARARSITAIHDLSFEKVPDSVDGPNAVFLRREVRNSVERSDLVTALTATMADEIAEHYDVPRDRIHLVGCAADRTRFYKRSDREVAEVKAAYGVFGRYVVTVGNIEPRKNQIRLIDAFCALPRPLTTDLTLVLIGAGAWNEALIHARVDEALAAGFKVKLLLGSVLDEHLPALYTGAELSVYASVYEGFGMPPLESMACQTPVLCSDRSVMPEVVGDAAVLVDPHSTEAVTAGLAEVLGLEPAARRDLVERGLRNVDRYSWAGAARALLDAVRSLEATRTGASS